MDIVQDKDSIFAFYSENILSIKCLLVVKLRWLSASHLNCVFIYTYIFFLIKPTTSPLKLI